MPVATRKIITKKDFDACYKTAWKWFSLYIRLRDATEYGFVKCCTCNTWKRYNDGMQAGHYLTQGAHRKIVFDEQNCHPQCVSCNHYKSGNLNQYTPYMTKQYGKDIHMELSRRDMLNPSYDYGTLRDIAKKYRILVKALMKEKNIL